MAKRAMFLGLTVFTFVGCRWNNPTWKCLRIEAIPVDQKCLSSRSFFEFISFLPLPLFSPLVYYKVDEFLLCRIIRGARDLLPNCCIKRQSLLVLFCSPIFYFIEISALLNEYSPHDLVSSNFFLAITNVQISSFYVDEVLNRFFWQPCKLLLSVADT